MTLEGIAGLAILVLMIGFLAGFQVFKAKVRRTR